MMRGKAPSVLEAAIWCWPPVCTKGREESTRNVGVVGEDVESAACTALLSAVSSAGEASVSHKSVTQIVICGIKDPLGRW